MNASDVLRYGHGTLFGTLEGLPEREMDVAGACGSWSVKDLIAHLGSYELVLVDVVRGLGDGGPTPHLDRFVGLGPAFNDAEVEARRSRSVGEVLAELDAAHAETLELVARLAPERLRETGTLPWYGTEYALDDLIVYQYYGHKREHGSQIEAFRDHGPRAGGSVGRTT